MIVFYSAQARLYLNLSEPTFYLTQCTLLSKRDVAVSDYKFYSGLRLVEKKLKGFGKVSS